MPSPDRWVWADERSSAARAIRARARLSGSPSGEGGRASRIRTTSLKRRTLAAGAPPFTTAAATCSSSKPRIRSGVLEVRFGQMTRAMRFEIQPVGAGDRDHLGGRGCGRQVERSARGDAEGERSGESPESDLGERRTASVPGADEGHVEHDLTLRCARLGSQRPSVAGACWADARSRGRLRGSRPDGVLTAGGSHPAGAADPR